MRSQKTLQGRRECGGIDPPPAPSLGGWGIDPPPAPSLGGWGIDPREVKASFIGGHHTQLEQQARQSC